jgi:hypothetical protein
MQTFMPQKQDQYRVKPAVAISGRVQNFERSTLVTILQRRIPVRAAVGACIWDTWRQHRKH